MSNRFKILVLGAFIAVSAFYQLAKAQTEYYYSVSQPLCATGEDGNNTSILVDGKIGSQSFNSSANTWRVQEISLYELDETGNIVSTVATVTTSVSSPYISSQIGSLVQFRLENALNGATWSNNVLTTGYYRLHQLTIWPNALPVDMFGKTLRVFVKFGSSASNISSTLSYDIDVAGAPALLTSSATYDEDNDIWVNQVCKGENIELSVDNGQYPLGTTPSYLGYTYEASYSWSLRKFGEGTIIDNYATGTSVSASDLTTGGSDIFSFTPYITYTEYKDGVETGKSCSVKMSPINIQYDSEVDLELSLDGNLTNSLKVCSGDEVTATFNVKKDDDYLYEGKVELYKEEDGVYNLVNSSDDLLSDDSFDLGVIEAKDKKNTTYNYKIKVYDLQNNLVVSQCSKEFYFSVTAIETDAKITFSDPGEVCEDGTVAISATIEGQNLGTYTYNWSGVDCTINSDNTTNGYYFADKNISYNSGKRTYRLTVSNEGCETYKDIEVITNERPVLTSLGDKADCYGEEVEIGVTSSQADVTYVWNPTEGTEVAGSNGAKRIVTVNYTKSYIVTATNNTTGCTTKDAATINVTMYPLPDITSVVASPYTICYGASTTLSATLSGGTGTITYHWEWNDGTVHNETTSSPTIEISPVKTSTITVYATDSKGCQSGESKTVDITVNELPDFTTTTDDACDGGSGSFTFSDNTLNYTVSSVDAPAGTGISVSGTVCTVNFVSASLTATKTYSFEVVGTNTVTGCSTTKTVSMKVNPLPTVTSTIDKTSICLGESVKLTATSGVSNATFQWVDETNAVVGTGKTLTLTPSVAGTHTYVVTATNPTTGCENTAPALSVTVNSLPEVSFSVSPETICEGNTTTLTASKNDATYTYKWSGGAVSGSGYQVTASPKSTTTYKMYVTDANGCKSTESSKTVTVNKKPVFTANVEPTEVCAGSTIEVSLKVTQSNASESTISHYTWNGSVTTLNPYTYSETWSANKTFTVVAYSDKGCLSDSKEVTVTVNPKPATPIPSASPVAICKDSGDEVTLSVASPVSGYRYEWYDESNVLVKTGSSVKVTPNVSTVYTVYAFDDNHAITKCQSDPATVSVSVVDNPDKPQVSSSQSEICSADGTDVTLSITNVISGLTYKWYTSANVYVDEGTSIVVSPSSTTSYYAIAQNSTECSSVKSDNIIVTVNVSPELTKTSSAKAVCVDYSITLSVSATGSNLEYHWSVDEDSHLSDNSISYLGVTAGPQTITVYAIDTATGCKSNTITFDITVRAKPTYTITPDESLRHVCEGNSIDLSVTHNASIPIISWMEDGAEIGSSENITVTPKKGSVYSIKIFDFATGCDVEEPFVLDVFSNPDVSVNGDDEYCVGTTIDVELVPNDGATYTSWKWTKGGTTYSTTNKLNIASATSEHNGTYSVEVTNISGCSAIIDVPITVYDKPTTTINGDDYVCNGGSFTLESADTFVSYSWVIGGSEVGTSKKLENFDASTYSVGDNIVVSLYVTDSQGCVSEAITKNITVRALPILTVSDKEYCLNEGGNMALEAILTNAFSGSSYTYYWSLNGATPVSTTTNTYTPEVSAANVGTWTVYAVENETGCTGEAVAFAVTVHEVSIAVNTNESLFCKDSGTILEITSTTTTDEDLSSCQYTYTIYDSSNNVVNSYVGGNTYSYTAFSTLPIGDYTVNVSVKTNAGCVAETSVVVSVVEAPGNSLTTETVCVGSDVTFTAETNATKWEFFVDGVSQGEQTSNVFVANGLVAGTEVYAILTLGTCQTTSEKAYVSYFDTFEPVASFTTKDNTCEGSNLSYTISSSTLNIASYKVFINDVEYEEKTLDVPSLTTEYNYVSTTDYNIYFVVTSAEGCVFTTNTLTPAISHANIENIKITELTGDTDLSDICVGKDYKLSFKAVGGIQKDLGEGLTQNVKFIITTDESVVYDTDSEEVTISFSTAGSHSIDFTVIDLNATGFCINNVTHFVNVNELPEATLNVTSHTASSGNIYNPCDDDELVFELSSSNFRLNVDGSDIDTDSHISVDGNKVTVKYDATDGEKTIFATIIDPSTGCESVTNTIVTQWRYPIEFTTNDPTLYTIDEGQIEICQGNTFTIIASSNDIVGDNFTVLLDDVEVASNVSSYEYTGTAIGTQVVTFIANYPTGKVCQSTVTIKTSEAPNPAVVVNTIDDEGNVVVADVIDSANKICSGEALTIVTTGGNSYSATVTRDGADVTSDFINTYSGTTFTQEYASIEYVENGSDYNEYVFSYVIKVGTCEDNISTTVRVYRPVVASMSIPSATIMYGTNVPVTITEGYDLYEYYVDGVLVASQDKSNPENNKFTVTDLPVGTSTITVKVTSEFGCSRVLTQEVNVLEGIAQLDVYLSNEYYCSDDNGVTIYVANPQVGITYRLGVGDEAALKACTTCLEITYDGTNGVVYSTVKDEDGNVISTTYAIEWTNIKIADGNNPTTYSVYGYHNSLPDEGVMMNNSVDVAEVKTPDVKEFRAEDVNGVERDLNFVLDHCTDDLLKVKETEAGVRYVLYLDGIAKAEVVGDGTDKYFAVDKLSIGEYTVVAYNTYNGNNEACSKDMNGTYTIDLPKAQVFDVYTTPENGNFCINNTTGVEIRLTGSEEGKTYYLFKEGSASPVQRDGADVAVVGNGEELSFGYFTEVGNYTVSCEFNDCWSDMSGVVTLTMYDLPLDQTVAIDNNGHYCAPVEGAEPDGLDITIGGQQEGYLYTLYRNNKVVIATDTEDNDYEVSHIGDNSGAAFTFHVTEAGTYTVKVTIPDVADGCEKTLETSVEVVVDELPNSVSLSFAYTTLSEELTICESAGLDAEGHPSDYATIHVTNAQDGVTYVLYNGTTVVDTHVEDDGDHYFTFDYLTAAGEYYIAASRSIDTGLSSYTCSQESVNRVTLQVVARPLSGGQNEVVVVEKEPAAKIAIDPCYGADITVTNAQENLTYVLYLLSEKDGEKVDAVQSIKADNSGVVVFENIQNKDGYYVIAVFNDYCEDDLADEIHVDINKFVEQQTVMADSKMCHGDVGNTVTLAGSEAGVTYKLYKGADKDDASKVLLSEIIGTGSSVSFETFIDEEAHYFVTGEDANGCPVQMYPSVDLQINPLPVAYELSGPTTYCDGEAGVVLSLSGSELGVDYILYKHVGTTLARIQTVKGTGSAISFDKPITEGTYEATARNAETECTSSMKGILTITKRDAVKDLDKSASTTTTTKKETLADAEENVDYVDLGLPSGTKWATYNVGATSAGAAGNYYAWGETATKSEYTNSNYDATLLTKYATSGLQTLELDDDAAYVNMGAGWRMPSMTEIQELYTTCEWTWSDDLGAGLSGYIVTGPNGQSIQIPSTGLFVQSLHGTGSGQGSVSNKISGDLYSSDIATLYTRKYINANGEILTTPLSQSEKTLAGDVNSDNYKNNAVDDGTIYGVYAANHMLATDIDDAYSYYLTFSPPISHTQEEADAAGYGSDWSADAGPYYYPLGVADYLVMDRYYGMNVRAVRDENAAKDIEVVVPVVADTNTIVSCDDYELKYENNLTADATYYLVPEGGTTAEAVAKVTSDGVTALTFTLTESGDYEVIGAYESQTGIVACESVVSRLIHFEKREPQQFTLVADNSCSGSATITLAGSEDGVEYYVVGHDELEHQIGDGNAITWSVGGKGIVEYQVMAKVTTDNGSCEVLMTSTAKVDFSISVVPDTKLVMTVNGEEQTYTQGDVISVCPSALVWLYGETNNVSIATYDYNFVYKDANGNDSTAITALSRSLSASKMYKQADFTQYDGKTLKVTLNAHTTSGCDYNAVDSIVFRIEAQQDAAKHLISITDEYDYCEGSPSVQLAYDTAYVGVTYRLWRYTKEDGSDLELMDIQEIPQYPNYPEGNGKSNEKTHVNLMFDGWAYSQSSAADSLYKAYATAGIYFVTYENEDGCEMRSDTVVVVENPLPKQDNQEVYYAVVDDKGNIDEDTRSDYYGMLNAGKMILTHARTNVTYHLVHIDWLDVNGNVMGDTILQTKTTDVDDVTLIFGPIKATNDTVLGWGEGTYVIRAIDNITGCEVDLGSIEFVDDDLVAYNVTLYINASQSSAQQLLIPIVGHKGNHKYIDWSTKIDVAYMPKTEMSTDGSIAVLDDAEEYTSGIGYSINATKANIVFKIGTINGDDPFREYLEKWEPGCDSIREMSGEYEYFKTTDDGKTKIKCSKEDSPTDSTALLVWRYYKTPSYYGTFGFNDYDGTDNLVTESKTGRFVYRKAPGFYGVETIPYYIYNEKYANYSRKCLETAYITIICGNEAIPGDSTALFLIPNAISPNGDGLNDDFEVILPAEYEDNHTSKLEVYNRWGTLVYRSSGLRYGSGRDCPNWDGTSKTANMVTVGNDLPQGTYFYIFTIDFNIDGEVRTKKLHGYVELRR